MISQDDLKRCSKYSSYSAEGPRSGKGGGVGAFSAGRRGKSGKTEATWGFWTVDEGLYRETMHKVARRSRLALRWTERKSRLQAMVVGAWLDTKTFVQGLVR
jgi:hypothetical protein